MSFQLSDDTLKKVFWLLLAFIFVVMLFYTPQYGITGDEITQYNYGKSVWAYISTFGNDKTAVSGTYLENNQSYYGGFFDGVAAMFISIFHPKDEFLLRHYWVMIFGFIGYMATGLLAKELGGWRLGVLSVVLLLFTSRYFGESFNNPKDTPFAATYILGMYAIIVWLKNIEKPTWKHTILLGLAIALCLGIRVGGLLLVAYLGLFYLVIAWKKNLVKDKKLSASLKHIVIAGLIGYFGATLWWPYALESPLTNPLEALKVMSSYPLQIRMLFEGHIIDSSQIPWYYLIKWLSVGLPLYLLLGYVCCILGIVFISRKYHSSYLWMVLFSAIFPVVYIIYQHSVVYDGLRHVLFTIPSIAIAASFFYVFVYDMIKSKAARYVFVCGLLILIALPARFMLANHPNEYVYFNELAGGIKGANGMYETDYYMNSIKQGYKWLLKNRLEQLPAKDTVLVATNCMLPMQQYEALSPVPFKLTYSRFYQKNEQDWDYAIYFGRFLDREELQNGYFPSSMAIHVISADGVALCTVLKNDPERNGFKGYTAMKNNDFPQAIDYFNKALAKYPDDIELWEDLTEVYYATGNLPAAANAADKAMAISSVNIQAAMVAGEIAMKQQDYKKASKIFEGLSEEYPDLPDAQKGLQAAHAKMGF